MIKIIGTAIKDGDIIHFMESKYSHLSIMSSVDLSADYTCGFLTNEGKFVNRQEAFKIAKEADQIKKYGYLESLYSDQLK